MSDVPERPDERREPTVLDRRTFLTRAAFTAGALTLPQLLAACGGDGSGGSGGGGGGGGGGQGGTVRVAIPGDPIMNPLIGNDASAVPFNRAVFASLTRPDPDDLTPQPDLAEKWESSEDLKTWTFTLRKNLKWSDGQPLTADDVVFTVEEALRKENGSALRGALLAVDKVTAVDPQTVKFELKLPVAPFPSIVSYNAGIVPKHVLSGTDIPHNGEFNTKKPVSSGPFTVESVEAGAQYTLAANPNYHFGKPKLDKLIFKILGDVNAQIAQLRSGEIDYLVIPPSNLSGVEGASNIDVVETPYIGVYHLSFNYTDPIFADPNVRKALVMAIDRPQIIKAVMKGQATPGVTPIPPIFNWAFDTSLQSPPFDPDGAKQMLATAGWKPGSGGILEKDGKKFAFSLDADTADPARQQSAVIAQQNFKAIGADVKLNVRPFPAYAQDLLAGKYQAHVGFWVLPPDPDITNYYSSEGFYNTIHYDNADVNRLLEEGRGTTDLEERKRIYFELQKVFLEDPPGAMLFYPKDIHAIVKGLKGIPNLPFRESLQYSSDWQKT
jgi:peptide/nickel transport system substrate-binding protein